MQLLKKSSMVDYICIYDVYKLPYRRPCSQKGEGPEIEQHIHYLLWTLASILSGSILHLLTAQHLQTSIWLPTFPDPQWLKDRQTQQQNNPTAHSSCHKFQHWCNSKEIFHSYSQILYIPENTNICLHSQVHKERSDRFLNFLLPTCLSPHFLSSIFYNMSSIMPQT